MNDKVVADIGQLSSGTVSRLAGTRLYSEIDAYRDRFQAWALQQAAAGKTYDTWQDAWEVFRHTTGV